MRCIPRDDGKCYIVEGNRAVFFGTTICHVDHEALARLQHKYAVVIHCNQLPANARIGFVVNGKAHLWNSETEDYEKFEYVATAPGTDRRH